VEVSQPVAVVVGGVSEGCHAHSVLREALKVDVDGDELFARGEALGLGQQLPVLVDEAVTVPGQVGGGFAGTGGGVRVGGDAARRLRRAQLGR
jgi:hypothetical protein